MRPTVNFVTCTVLRHATLFVSGNTKYCVRICYLRTFCDTMKAFYGLAPMGTCEVTCENRVCTWLGLQSMGRHPEVWGLNSANLAMWVWQVIDHNGLNVVKLCEKTLYKAYKLATEIYLSWDRYHVRNLYDVISTVLWQILPMFMSKVLCYYKYREMLPCFGFQKLLLYIYCHCTCGDN